MKSNALLLLTAGLFALTACSTTPTKVSSGLIHARTFSFVSRKTDPAYADKRAAVHQMIQNAIAKNLAARGVTRVASGGDVTVPYLVIIGNNVTTTAVNDYFGYSNDLMALHDKAHSAYTGSKNPNDFEAGTLLIDIVDGKTFKLLKRGYATRSVLKDLPADARAARIQGVVDDILKDVRFAP